MVPSLFTSPLYREFEAPNASTPAPAPKSSKLARRARRPVATTQERLADFDRLFTAYLAKESTVLSPRTIAAYKGAYAMYRRFLVDGIDLTPEGFDDRIRDLDGYAEWNRLRGIALITVNTYWRGIRGFFRYLEVHQGMANPYRLVKAPRFQTPPPKARSAAECHRILVAAANHPAWSPFQRARAVAVLGVMLYGGLRRGEAVRLLNSDVDLAQRSIRILHGKGPHGGKTRYAELNDELLVILRVYLRERGRIRATAPEFFTTLSGNSGITASAIRQIARKVSVASGVPFSAHTLRHSFVTQLLRAGVPIHVVRDLAGHADIATTLSYTRVFSEDRRRAARRLSFA